MISEAALQEQVPPLCIQHAFLAFYDYLYERRVIVAIDLDTNPGGLFRRIGREVYSLNNHNSRRAAMDTEADNIDGQYQSTRQSDVDQLYSQLSAAQSAMSGWPFAIQQIARTTLIGMVDDDTALSQATLQAAMPILIAQMIASVDTVLANVVSVTPTPGSGNTGTAVCIASLKGPDGKDREYVYAETIVATAVIDSQSETASAGSESWSAVGEIAANDVFGSTWPLGSGASNSYTSNDPATGNNYIANGDFADWTTTNIPDNFVIVTGTAGTTVFEETTIVYRGTSSLRILGNGSELTTIKQMFNQSSGSGSTFNLLPSTVYAFHCWLRVSSVPAAGVVVFELTNLSGTIINNDQGTANRVTKDLTTATTSFASCGGFFQTPKVLPTTTPFNLRIRLSTALSNTVSAYIAEMIVTPAAELYRGGPYIAIFPGSTNTVVGDTFSIAVANDWGGGFQKAFERLFGMKQLGMQLPSAAAGETIPNSYIA